VIVFVTLIECLSVRHKEESFTGNPLREDFISVTGCSSVPTLSCRGQRQRLGIVWRHPTVMADIAEVRSGI